MCPVYLVKRMNWRAVIAQSVWRWAAGWKVGVLGFDSRRGLGIFFFFTTASRTALGPTQPLTQWVPGALSLGVERPRREADRSPSSSAEVKECVELYFHSPNTPSWHGAQFKKTVRRVRIVKLFVVQFSPFSFAFLCLRFKQSPRHFVLKCSSNFTSTHNNEWGGMVSVLISECV
jgi:hypothetical protein